MGEVIVLNDRRNQDERYAVTIAELDQIIAAGDKLADELRAAKSSTSSHKPCGCLVATSYGPEAIVESSMMPSTAELWRKKLLKLAGNLRCDHPVWMALSPVLDALGYKAHIPGYEVRS